MKKDQSVDNWKAGVFSHQNEFKILQKGVLFIKHLIKNMDKLGGNYKA